MNPLVTVTRDPFVPGTADEGVLVGPLDEALLFNFGSDAHTQQGYSADRHRVTRRSLERGPIELTCIIFDLDGPNHVAEPAWLENTTNQLVAACTALGGGYGYRTRNGWRLVLALREPFAIASPPDWERWRDSYHAVCGMLRDRFGLEADRSCNDPSRLFRMPRVVRDGVEQVPDEIGSVFQLGSFALPAAPDPRMCVLTFPAHDSGPRAMPASAGNVSTSTRGAEPLGQLYRLCRRGRLIVGRGDRGIFIRCPNQRQHHTGSPGDGSTILFPSAHAAGVGRIHCLHTACADLDTEDWFALLGAPRVRRVVRIVRGYELGDDGDTKPTAETIERIRLEVAPIDGLGLVYPPEPGWPEPPATKPTVIDVAIPHDGGSEAVRTRFDSLWIAAGIAAPKDLDPSADMGGAVDELAGRTIELEMSDGELRRLLPRKVG